MPLMLVAVQELLDIQPETTGERLVGSGAMTSAAGPHVVTATARLQDPEPSTSGAVRAAIVALSIKPGWHLYANPTGVDNMKPTTLVLEAQQGAGDLRVAYPAGRAMVLGSLGQEKVALYEGMVEIPIRFTLDPGARTGKVTLTLKLNYQACDDKVCLAPASLAIPLVVAPNSPASREKSKP
jgi:DsbC/DsbD-like thiol-disulfide interchange protein